MSNAPISKSSANPAARSCGSSTTSSTSRRSRPGCSICGRSRPPSQISYGASGTSMRLRQILNNFTSNALKFTTEGSVTIAAVLAASDDDGDTVQFTVTDTGIGISPENQKKLFQPFVQAESDTTRRFGGTGLGLVICRRLADLMGGAIDMESVP